MINFKGKKFLLTHWALAVLGGSENNILQMAEYIQSQGGEVEFFTYAHADPLKSIIEQKNIPVIVDDINLLDNSLATTITYDLEEYDYVVVCQNVIPIDIIRQLNKKDIRTKFIFWHMSSFVGVAMEAPLFYELETSIADKVLTISEEATTEQLERMLGKDIKNLTYYRNPVPDDFITNYQKRDFPRTPQKIAVISNHPPKEIVELAKEKEIIENNAEIDFIGRWSKNQQLVTAELLAKYDLIISIGKTVQYCLVCGVPVYVYDRFGGQGFLTDYESAKKRNFSGREAGKKTSKVIANELFGNYQKSIGFQEKNLQSFRDDFLLSKNIGKVFPDEKKEPLRNDFSEEYINYLISMQMLLKEKMTTMIHAQGLLEDRMSKNELLSQKERDLKQKVDRLNELQSVKRSARLFAGNVKRRIKNGKDRTTSTEAKK